MDDDLTHASFFSGAGGLDLGLERAGWRTVSFSEIDPYASAVLAEQWPGVPNLGDIVHVNADEQRQGFRDPRDAGSEPGDGVRDESGQSGWRSAALWTGGFPCQDLSVAGKRRGMGAGTRSGLAFSFLELVGRHRPRFVLLENVPGLLSSHAGRDFGTLLATLVELGYGVGYRVLDARYFGVPQRRRRVFILGDSLGGRAGAERAAEVLSVGSRCHRHPPTGIEAGEDAADRARPGVDIVGTIPAGLGHHGNGGHSSQAVNSGHVIVGPSPDASRMRAPDGLARGPHDRDGLADTLREHPRPGSNSNGALIAETLNSGGNAGGFRTESGAHLVFTKRTRGGINATHGHESWGDGELAGTLDSIGQSARTATAIVGASGMTDDPLLPLGLDSNRYRCCGNGVVADVGEWIGRQLIASLERAA